MKKAIDRLKYDSSMIRFILVGIINTLVGTSTMFLLYNWVGCSYWFSSAANYIVGSVCSFFLNKFYTFKNTEKSWGQIVRFILSILFCYLVGYGIAKPLVRFFLSSKDLVIQENIAMLVGMSIFVLLNYYLQRLFVFSAKS